jgi:hypothetical protein
MMIPGRKTIGVGLLVLGALVAATRFGAWEIGLLNRKVDQLTQEKEQLVRFAERLSATRRVAQINVLEQTVDDLGMPMTVLRWQEIAADGALGAPVVVEVYGKQVYVESLVIKFEHQHVGEGEPGRSTSLALFRRLFGDYQSPHSAPELDRYRPPPQAYSGVNSLSPGLWDRFWDMVDDPRVARRFGVRVAQCEAPSVPMAPGQVWELSLDAAGGINFRRMDDGKSWLANSR